MNRLVKGILAIGCCAVAQAGHSLPVFLADNHAETAAWISRTFDLDAPHTLVLIDAHSDASAAERSEELREQMRRVADERELAGLFENWRSDGRLQAYNWIEPLMPRPVDRVFWVATNELDATVRSQIQREAVESLDGRLEVEPRSVGSLANRWSSGDLSDFHEWRLGRSKTILAIDLDFFAGMNEAERERHFSEIWTRAMDWPGLAGVALAISRPWLSDDKEADDLVTLAARTILLTCGASLELDIALDDRPDTSRKAVEASCKISRWDLNHSSVALRMVLRDLGCRLRLHHHGRPCGSEKWRESLPSLQLQPSEGEIDIDNVWRYPAGSEPVLRVDALTDATGRMRWYLLEDARTAYDLLPESGLGKAFSENPARWVHRVRKPLGETFDFQLDPSLWSVSGGGRYLLQAEVETSSGWLPTKVIDLRVRTQEGFRGAISECMRMPYVFGIAGVTVGDLSGVETGWGADCSNLLIHAWRRSGIPLTWGDPGRLRIQLSTKAENLRHGDSFPISKIEIERGVLVDFGQHVAAIWQDNPPFGMLDAGDLAVHHLGGSAEIVTLGSLTRNRGNFCLRVPEYEQGCRIRFAGDVVLAGDDRHVIDEFQRGRADAFVINLEGIPSDLPPDLQARHDFRFSADRLKWLREKGVDAVSLANNHSLDADNVGLLVGMDALSRVGIGSFGAGKTDKAACKPWTTEREGVWLSIFGVSYFPEDAAGPDRPGVACLPIHKQLLEMELSVAVAAGHQVIVMVHGGDEYHPKVNEDQRKWARWLIGRGADAIIGSHPHVNQREEFHGGAVVLHSLGNAVYPETLKGADSGSIRTLPIRAGKKRIPQLPRSRSTQ